ncbi:MAG: cysteine desulfurase family protein [Acidobacteriota bacterium]
MSDAPRIYLDHNATTPVDARVLAAMLPTLRENFANAASPHRAGEAAAAAVDRARGQVAALLGADPREIVWTSGATESNNLALKGVAASSVHAARRRHIVTVRTEHLAVLDPCRHLAQQGFELTVLGVDGQGRVDLDALAATLRDDTLLVSIMYANNETGVIHPVEDIGRLCKARGVLFHTDATQAFGRCPIDVEAMGIDLLSLSAHKAYGPKGAGALYVRRRRPRVRCEPLLHGGGHERGRRSGTLNVPGIVGLGAAAEICAREMDGEWSRLGRLRNHLEKELVHLVAGTTVHGEGARRLANTSNMSFPGRSSESLMKKMPEIAVSSSSACTSATRMPSYVLAAHGLAGDVIRSSIRFSLGRSTTDDEIEQTIRRVAACCQAA